MKIRVADYIAQLLLAHGIRHVFSVGGGGSMHLNDAFGNCPGLQVIYNNHEQACAIAAEGYARVNGVPAAVCVTTGPGGTNTITGVLCAWQDNIPMVLISGQVRYDTTVESTGLQLRQFGEQEHYIVDTVKSITKYAVMITDASSVRYHVEKAYYLAMQGRCGPVWLDIPLNIQSMIIETDDQKPFVPEVRQNIGFSPKRLLDLLRQSERPVILAGSGVRAPGVYERFRKFIEQARLPVLAATSNADILPEGHPLYFGNFGVFGGRPGNFLVQNADCLLVLGCRLSFKEIGFNYQQFAPNAVKIMVDADINELKKPTVKIDLPICVELSAFFGEMLQENLTIQVSDEWMEYGAVLKRRYPVYMDRFYYNTKQGVNPYYFYHEMRKHLKADAIIVAGNSTSSVEQLQLGVEKDGQRLWGNVSCGTMGYDLPASLGAAVAGNRQVICVTGDGSIQMNIQELATIAGYGLPVKVVIFNNGGYGALVQTQSNFFGRLSGCTRESGVFLPNFEKLAEAYGYPYVKCSARNEVSASLDQFFSTEGFGICEVIEEPGQVIEPKQKSKALSDGTIFSPPISDLAPFLDKEENERYSDFASRMWKSAR